MTQAHINSRVPIQSIMTVDKAHTRFMAHYDVSATDIYGARPYDSYIEDNTVLCYTADSLMQRGADTYVLDKSMWSNYGKIYGSVTTQSGLSGNALLFDGATGYIECLSNNRLKGIGRYVSVEAWVYYTAYGGTTTYSVIAVKGNPWTFLLENPNNTFRFRATINNVDTVATDSVTHNLNEWYHLVGTYDEQALRLYKNGELVAETQCPGKLNVNDKPVRIGNFGSSYHFTGMIDRVAVYDRTLSAVEIKRRYRRSMYSIVDTGKFQGCMSLGGAKGVTYDNPIPGCRQFTISMWAKVTALNTNNTNTILSINDWATGNAQTPEVVIDTLTGDSNKIRMFSYNDSLATSIITGPICTLNTWIHLVFVRELNKNIMYIDGVKIGEIAASSYSLGTGIMQLGDRDSNVDRHIEGLLIDELRIDDIVRTEEEIHQWYLAENPFYPKGIERMV